jgi:hypothetical protein
MDPAAKYLAAGYPVNFLAAGVIALYSLNLLFRNKGRHFYFAILVVGSASRRRFMPASFILVPFTVSNFKVFKPTR